MAGTEFNIEQFNTQVNAIEDIEARALSILSTSNFSTLSREDLISAIESTYPLEDAQDRAPNATLPVHYISIDSFIRSFRTTVNFVNNFEEDFV